MAGPPEVTPDLVITDAECDAIFARDLAKYEAAVCHALDRPIPQDSFDACVSLCYNIGPAGFGGSTVVRRINAGDLKGAADAFMLWNKPSEIVGRRRSEQQQFMAGLETATHVPAAPAAPTVDPVHAPVAPASQPPLVQPVPAPPPAPKAPVARTAAVGVGIAAVLALGGHFAAGVTDWFHSLYMHLFGG